MYIRVYNKPKTSTSKSFFKQLTETQYVSKKRMLLWQIALFYTFIIFASQVNKKAK